MCAEPKLINETLRRVFQWLHHTIEPILAYVFWNAAYLGSLRYLG